jgi:hypothetical protein
MITAFTESDVGDYIEFREYKYIVPAPIEYHSDFKIMGFKPHHSYLFGRGSIKLVVNWLPENDDDVRYYIDNFASAPNAFPAEILTLTEDWDNRTLTIIIDSSKYVKNKWYNVNHHYTPALPTKFESLESGTAMTCILHNPDYTWNIYNIVLENEAQTSFTKPTPANEYYVTCMNNQLDLSSGKTINPIQMYRLVSDEMTFIANHGDVAIAVLEKVTKS